MNSDGQDHGHGHQRRGRVARLGRLERGHAGGDRLGPGEGDGARRERPEQDQEPDVSPVVRHRLDDLGRWGSGPVSPSNRIRNTPAPIITNALTRNR